MEYITAKKKLPSKLKEDVRVNCLHAVITGDKFSGDAEMYNYVQRAYSAYKHVYKKEVLEAMLLSGMTYDEIHDTVRVPQQLSEVYEYLFFDMDVFEDDLDIIDYAHTYSEDEFGKDLKILGCDLGKEALMIKLSRGTHVTKSRHIKEEIRTTAFMLAQYAKLNPMRSDVSKEAHRWANLSLKAAALEDDLDGDSLDALLLALEDADEVKDESTSGIKKDDIIH
jgi:hypothetical protein